MDILVARCAIVKIPPLVIFKDRRSLGFSADLVARGTIYIPVFPHQRKAGLIVIERALSGKSFKRFFGMTFFTVLAKLPVMNIDVTVCTTIKWNSSKPLESSVVGKRHLMTLFTIYIPVFPFKRKVCFTMIK